MSTQYKLGQLSAKLDRLNAKKPRRSRSRYAKFFRAYPPDKFMYQAQPRSESSLATYGASYRTATPAQLAARAESRVFGRGAYGIRGSGGYIADALSGLGKFAGGSLGGRFGLGSLGGAAGGYLGKLAGGAIEGFTGMGDYVESGAVAPILGNEIVSGPSISSDMPSTGHGMGTIVVRHREFIGNVYGPPDANFTITQYDINPGLEGTFPWLSQIAQNYDEYQFHQLLFEYKTMVADFAATTGQVGQVILATQYNANLPPFPSKRAMLEYQLAQDSKTSQSMIHGVECDPSKLSTAFGKYTRAGPPQAGQDLNTLDHGTFYMAVDSIPAGYANQILGELWVTYTLELRKPKSFANQSLGIPKDIFISDQIVWPTSSFPATPATTKISNLAVGQQNSIGTTVGWALTCDTNTPGIDITFPPGVTGAFEINVTFNCNDIIATVNPGDFSAFQVRHNTTGGIELIEDLWRSGSNAVGIEGGWQGYQMCTTSTPIPEGSTTNNYVNTVMVYRMHVRVSDLGVQTTPPTLNTVQLSPILWNAPYLLDYASNAIGMTLDITEYNTRPNNRFTDAPLLVDAGGNLITTPNAT